MEIYVRRPSVEFAFDETKMTQSRIYVLEFGGITYLLLILGKSTVECPALNEWKRKIGLNYFHFHLLRWTAAENGTRNIWVEYFLRRHFFGNKFIFTRHQKAPLHLNDPNRTERFSNAEKFIHDENEEKSSIHCFKWAKKRRKTHCVACAVCMTAQREMRSWKLRGDLLGRQVFCACGSHACDS